MAVKYLVPTALTLASAGLSACAPNTLPARPPNATGAPTGQPVTLVRYNCDSGARISARYPDNDRVLLNYHGEPHRMTLARSASGPRYADDDLAWWTKGVGPGTEASLFRLTSDGETGEKIESCQQTGT